MIKPLIAAMALVACASANADPAGTIRAALVKEVVDGDTFIIEQSGIPLTVDLESIDAPELDQSFGPESKLHLTALIEGQRVNIEQVRTLAYRHITANVKLNDLDVNRAMITSGMAWYNKDYDNNVNLKTLQNSAKKSKIGLWSQKHPVDPAVYRNGPQSKYVQPFASISYEKSDTAAGSVDEGKGKPEANASQPKKEIKSSFVAPPPMPPAPAAHPTPTKVK